MSECMTLCSEARARVQVAIARRCMEINRIHTTRFVCIVQRRRQLRPFGVLAVAQKRLDHGSMGICVG